MELSKILNGIENIKIINDLNIIGMKINQIQFDSRKVEENDMFVCVKGYDTNGHLYIDSAVKNGAKFVVVSEEVDYANYPEIVFIKCDDDRKFLAEAAINYYDNPSSKLKMIGVTGTKGKTTTTYILRNIIEKNNIKVGLIGTNGIEYNGKRIESSRTTPENLDLQRILAAMVSDGVEMVVMEVSSHALDLNRVYGITFEAAAFTNLSREHLGFHKTFENYFNAKAKLFDICKVGIINVDDEYGAKLYNEKQTHKISIGINHPSDIHPLEIDTNIDGSIITLSDIKLDTKLFGEFNMYNILTAYALSLALGLDPDMIKEGIKNITIPGRMEFVPNVKNYNVIVDYAHSVDSLKQVLVVLQKHVKNNLILVFGCGGGGLQDPLKRQMMGEVANQHADYIIVTEDNSRDEDVLDITSAIEKGFNGNKPYEIIVDRAQAIKRATELYNEGDLILIAGKGHEKTQEYKDKVIYFSDVQTVQDCLK